MKYLFRISFCLVFMLFFIGAQEKDIRSAGAIDPDFFYSEVNVQNADSKNETYVLIQFWAAYNPQSRMENTIMHNSIINSRLKNIRLLSISLDDSDAVFLGVVKADKLKKSTQLRFPSGQRSDVLKEYCLQEGYNNRLMDSRGEIVAKNLSPEEVLKIVSSF